MNKKNILFLSSAPHIYGGEVNLLHLLKTLDTDSFNATCFYHPDSKFENYDIGKTKLSGFIFPKFMPRSILFCVLQLLRLLIFIKVNRINLVYVNVVNDFKLIGILKKFLNVPVILHIHIDEPDESLRWLSVDRADRILFPSQSTLSDVLSHSPWIDPQKCFFVHNAVDTTIFNLKKGQQSLDEFGVSGKGPLIAIVGQIKQIKGQHLFVEMARELSKKGISADFLIIGGGVPGAEAYEQGLKLKVAEYGLDDTVRFTGFRPDVPELLNLCDLIVVPSLHEPFGRVVIEAMACGSPVVASSVGGIVEIFKNGEGGLFFAPGDLDDLVSKVCYFFEHPEWWEQQKLVAHEHATQNFSQSRHTDAIQKHIEDLCDFMSRRVN